MMMMCVSDVQKNFFFFFTWEHVESRLFVVSGVSVIGVADDHTGFAHSSISHQHAADHWLRVRLMRVLLRVLVPLLHIHWRNSDILVEIIHLGWHVQHRKSEKSLQEETTEALNVWVKQSVVSPHSSQTLSHTPLTLWAHTLTGAPSPLQNSFVWPHPHRHAPISMHDWLFVCFHSLTHF